MIRRRQAGGSCGPCQLCQCVSPELPCEARPAKCRQVLSVVTQFSSTTDLGLNRLVRLVPHVIPARPQPVCHTSACPHKLHKLQFHFPIDKLKLLVLLTGDVTCSIIPAQQGSCLQSTNPAEVLSSRLSHSVGTAGGRPPGGRAAHFSCPAHTSVQTEAPSLSSTALAVY